MSNRYAEFVAERLTAGDDPNAITAGIEAALNALSDWSRWGDGRFYLNAVCSICGSALAGVCGHRHDPERRLILRSAYEARRATLTTGEEVRD